MSRDRSFDRQLRSPDFLLTRNHGPRHVADERQLKGKSPEFPGSAHLDIEVDVCVF